MAKARTTKTATASTKTRKTAATRSSPKSKSKSKSKSGTISRAETTEPRVTHVAEPRTIDGNASILVLQLPETIGTAESGYQVEHHIGVLTLEVAIAKRDKRRRGQDWIFFLAQNRPHFEDLSTWLGFSGSIPEPVRALIRTIIQGLGVTRSGLEYGQIGPHQLRPIFALTDAGIEVPPLSASMHEDDELLAHGLPVVRRTFVVTR